MGEGLLISAIGYTALVLYGSVHLALISWGGLSFLNRCSRALYTFT